jgi:hypothetical protein
MAKKSKPQIDNSLPLRPVIRETMQMAPARRWTEKLLHAQIRREFPDVTEADVRAALIWNQGKGFVDYRYIVEFERDEWYLTERGKAAAI